MPRIPHVRAVSVQAALAELDLLPRPLRAAITARLPREALTLENVVSVAWVPFALNLAIIDAAYEVLDLPMFRKFSRDVALTFVKRPILSALLDASTRLFGVKPQSLFRWSPRAWQALFRNCGRLEYEATGSPTESRLRLLELPTQVLASGAFVIGMAASFEAVFTITRTRGTVEVLSSERTSGEVCFLARDFENFGNG